ncbi:hypothetical protein GUITHDRAFT_136224 [Guillardia theta CCMP2712]|uniref:Uncharacterized protein n=1 Tax=Guillardia theta (strain CCMP2712) TaxID=905079 RepID=L1JLJ5_GUITC|nr:hypothetical protein GUITHDRAFT_136224 [Guillardia theta CCMP2712]EKX49039.1 hypothetical protein GUITHDRAFT_136224 [Guillardia theta CCMP2712]|eukprot:XP_005836019.1 hypothetical protein GUITHDRAFT_136224 [Guillardia theta CCMP2712]
MQGSHVIQAHGIVPVQLRNNAQSLRQGHVGLRSVQGSAEGPSTRNFEALNRLYSGGAAGKQKAPSLPNALFVFVAVVGIVLDSLLPPSGQTSFMMPLALPRRKPFFDGWFIRITDLAMKTSCSLIVGSMRRSGSESFNEHYVSISFSSPRFGRKGHKPYELQSFHHVSTQEEVSILFDERKMSGFENEIDWRAPAAGRCSSFSWESKECGSMRFLDGGARVEVDMRLRNERNEVIELRAKLRQPKPWGYARVRGERLEIHSRPSLTSRKNEAGPEGWLGRTPLLPCRYFVQSLGSECSYTLRRRCGGMGNSSRVYHLADVCVSGGGFAHVETNYGAAFPSGHEERKVLTGPPQVIGPENRVALLVTGGKFKIGGLTPLTWIVAFRVSNTSFNFRTTDLHQVKARFSCSKRTFSLEAFNPFSPLLLSRSRFHLTALSAGDFVQIEANDANMNQDEQNVWVPTLQGFTNKPGCSESFAATVRVRAWKGRHLQRRNEDAPDFDESLRLAALEFGGEFQQDSSSS